MKPNTGNLWVLAVLERGQSQMGGEEESCCVYICKAAGKQQCVRLRLWPNLSSLLLSPTHQSSKTGPSRPHCMLGDTRTNTLGCAHTLQRARTQTTEQTHTLRIPHSAKHTQSCTNTNVLIVYARAHTHMHTHKLGDAETSKHHNYILSELTYTHNTHTHTDGVTLSVTSSLFCSLTCWHTNTHTHVPSHNHTPSLTHT